MWYKFFQCEIIYVLLFWQTIRFYLIQFNRIFLRRKIVWSFLCSKKNKIMAKIEHPSKKVEMQVLNNSLKEQKEYFEKYWLLPSSQLLLLESGREESRDLYLSMRRPCKEFVTAVLSEEKPDMDLVRRSVVGCSLSPENEVLLVELEDWDLLEAYSKENPQGTFLSDEAIECLEELGQDELAEKFAAPEVVHASTSMGGLFSPEMLAKLGI